jgi:hypothetical protein
MQGRSPDRTEEQDHKAMGAAWDTTLGTARSADALGLHLRGHLPGPGDRRRPRPAALQYRCNGFASGRNLTNGDTEGACCLLIDQAGWHLSTQPGRKHLAVHPRELALQPRVSLLRRHPRALLLCMEQARRPAMDHHVDRSARMGISVLISEIWYSAIARFSSANDKKRRFRRRAMIQHSMANTTTSTLRCRAASWCASADGSAAMRREIEVGTVEAGLVPVGAIDANLRVVRHQLRRRRP